MTNDLPGGFLPKARRSGVGTYGPKRPRQRHADCTPNAYEDDNLFLTMARRPGVLERELGVHPITIYGGGR